MDKVIILSGLSGSGKSTAIKYLEDYGFFCIDNLPPKLIYTFIDLCNTSFEDIKKVAIVLDIRIPDKEILKNFENLFNEIKDKVKNVELIFLECSTEAIIQRYKETRRSHPLAFDGDLIEGINEEIKLLSEIKKYSDHTIDTTNYNVHKLKEIIQNIVGSDESKSLTLSFVSFGYKYGFPYDADIVWDVRFLQSPHFIKSLKDFDGYNEKIIEFVLSDNDSVEFIKKFQNMLDFLIPKYINEGKSYLTIAIGCTGGKHRSVVITNEISKKYHNYSPQIRHRDINKL